MIEEERIPGFKKLDRKTVLIEIARDGQIFEEDDDAGSSGEDLDPVVEDAISQLDNSSLPVTSALVSQPNLPLSDSQINPND
jgi:hypothetical protein